ncbi:MAG TPA: hypothetical protein VKA74_05300 [Myxococcota bacterium]|nr:hypothetical protein [Myxococcota bacterium]
MRPHQIFGAMSPEKCEAVFARIEKESPETVQQAVIAAAAALRFRPKYLLKQPVAKRIASVRRALARVQSAALAEEILAVYFLKCRADLLTEWLDSLGLAHEEGVLTDEEIVPPEKSELERKVAEFRAASEDEDRELLLRTFSAQAAIDWPVLDELVGERLG